MRRAASKSHVPHCRYMVMRFLLCLTVHPIPLWFWTRGPDFWFRGPAVASETRSSFSTQGLADAPCLSSPRKAKAQIDLGSAFSYLQIFSPKPLILLPYQPHLLSVNPQCPLFSNNLEQESPTIHIKLYVVARKELQSNWQYAGLTLLWVKRTQRWGDGCTESLASMIKRFTVRCLIKVAWPWLHCTCINTYVHTGSIRLNSTKSLE